MSLGVHIAADPASAVRKAARVKRVAELLDENEREVRRLLRCGELEGYTKGKRGVRIYLDSVQAYQERRQMVPTGSAVRPCPPARRQPAVASSAAYRSALAGLRAKGII